MLLGKIDRPPRGLKRVLVLSLAAAALPVTGTFLFPSALQDYEALMWLLLLVPAFLWAFERGWSGVATALALGMAALSLTYAISELRGDSIPDLLYAVVTVYVGVTLGIGVFGERVSRAKLKEAADIQALQDPLTGMPNRLHAETHLVMEFAAALRGQALAVVLFDLDHLRLFNARHGRDAGDQAMKRFGDMLRQRTRRVDLSGRYGVKGFVSILTGCTEDGAVIFAARLQEMVRAAADSAPMPTVSVGIASYDPSMNAPAELLRAAESALALAKQDGRDRVRIHGRTLADLGAPDPFAPHWTLTEPSHGRRRDNGFVADDVKARIAAEAGRFAHDFNNLLACIHGHAELLLDRFNDDEDARASVVEIRDAAERAAALTRQLTEPAPYSARSA